MLILHFSNLRPMSRVLLLQAGSNDTLNNDMCPNDPHSHAECHHWLAKYAPPIMKRLNKWAPGAKLTDKDTHSLMSLCAFETLHNEQASPFCDLFEQDEWDAFEYYGDLTKYYGHGYARLHQFCHVAGF